jgi:hypothetical protein
MKHLKATGEIVYCREGEELVSMPIKDWLMEEDKNDT